MKGKLARALLLLVLFVGMQAASYCNTIEYFQAAAHGEELDDIDPEDVVPQDPFLPAGLSRSHFESSSSRNSSSAPGIVLLSFVRQLLVPDSIYRCGFSAADCEDLPLALDNPIWLLTRKLLI